MKILIVEDEERPYTESDQFDNSGNSSDESVDLEPIIPIDNDFYNISPCYYTIQIIIISE